VREPLQIGQSRLRREEDTVLVRIVGYADMVLGTPLHAWMEETMQECGRCYLICDVAAMTGADPELRRYASEWHKTHKIIAVLCHGASFPIRVLVTLLQGAVRVVSGRTFGLVFVRDEADARAWIAAHRARAP
jgi:hypothetical protein